MDVGWCARVHTFVPNQIAAKIKRVRLLQPKADSRLSHLSRFVYLEQCSDFVTLVFVCVCLCVCVDDVFVCNRYTDSTHTRLRERALKKSIQLSVSAGVSVALMK